MAGSLALGAGASKGVAYRWIDENGIVHYGDRLPPQYAAKESSILNKQGVEVGHTEAQKTPEQLAEEKSRADALLRQKQHDAFLLTTYTSVKDIEALRDERLVQISGQRRAAEAYVEGLHARLNNLQERAKNFAPYSDKPGARRMPDDLAEDLVRTMNEMNAQKKALEAKDAEESALRAQFQADIERYQQLRKVANR
ncbi:MAG TPA: DUF4124 domain-containing protein [Steroidobacteraceae bacterium]|nr:DUF4124 domain-containing protein [Steroidobacteraceae bacterium]